MPDAIAGSTSTRAALCAAWPQWPTWVEHADTVDADTAQDAVRAARGVLVPSTWDVFNFAGAEAMAAGAVVVASDGAGMATWIGGRDEGFRVPADDPRALAEALAEADALPADARARMGEAARARVGSLADPDAVAAREAAALRALGAPLAGDDPLDDLLRGRGGHPSIDALLAQHPLREILRHAARRVRGRWGRG